MKKIDMKKIRTDAEMASVENMANEINKTIKPITINGVTYHNVMARVMGPERVRISHNKNSTPIGEIYPQLRELAHV